MRKFQLLVFWITVLLTGRAALLPAQNKALVDSILRVLPKAAEDTNKAEMLTTLGWEVSYGDLEKGLGYCKEGLALTQKLKFERGEAAAWNAVGTIYHDLGEYSKAIDAHQHSIRIREKLDEPRRLGSSYLNIGIVYSSMDQPQRCIYYMQQAIAQMKRINYETGLCVCYNNLGSCYNDLDSTQKALSYFLLGEEIARRKQITTSLAASLAGIALCRAAMNDYPSADLSINESIRMLREKHLEYELISTLGTLAGLREKEKRYDDAIAAVKEALGLAEKIGKVDSEKELTQQLSYIYEHAGKYAEALEAFRKFTAIKDSLLSESNQRHIREMDAQFDKERRDREIETLKHTNDQQELIAQRQNLIIMIIVVALVFLILLAIMLLARSKTRKRANLLLLQQKEIIEEKNKNITDSINYAQKIQQALLPTPSEFGRSGLHQGFVLYRPKDIVSGDFYWMASRDDSVFLAIADCTGHGVPGGFMSMLGAALLNEIINDKDYKEPAAILDLMREKVILALRQTGTAGESKDGMDMVLWRLDKKDKKLVYAAANNSFYIVRNGTLLEQPADKQPVGYHAEQRPFTQREVQLELGDHLYGFTDGYADQFGGPGGKKFKYKRFQELLITCSKERMDDQDDILSRTFDQWKGNLEQVDDVLVIGVKI